MILNRNYQYRFYRENVYENKRFRKLNIVYNESDLLILYSNNDKIDEEQFKRYIKDELIKSYETVKKYCINIKNF